MEETLTIQGSVEHIQCQKDNGWAVAMIYTKDGRKLAITGVMPPLKVGMNCQVTGKMTNNTYGQQLKVDSFMETRPDDIEGIYKYLASGLIKNIGPVLARKIVDTFGDKTLDVLDYSPERLKEVYGIGKKRIGTVIEAVKEQREIRSIMIWLKRYEISNTLAVKIFQKYGTESIATLEENPYILADDLHGVGFKKADDTAKKLGIPRDSTFRIQSGILAYLSDRATQGNTCTELQKAIKEVSSDKYLSLPEDLVRTQLNEGDNINKKVKVEDGSIFLSIYYNAEKTIAWMLLQLDAANIVLPDADIKSLAAGTGIEYSPEQAHAITQAASRQVSILTGGPGTGKTATTNGIIKMFEKNGMSVLLAAPTGRAAKRMSEVTGHEAKTIHRLLEYCGNGFQRNETCPIEADVVIIDESSMIDTLLMCNLLKAIVPPTKLVLVGDVDQLPSVGAGSVLRDIIDSNRITTTVLNTIFRQAQDSDIIVNAHRINNGHLPVFKPRGVKSDCVFVECGNTPGVAEKILRSVQRLKEKGWKDNDIQVLSPMRREWDEIGSTELNVKLQALLNPTGKVVATRAKNTFRLGDRIMQTKNNYDKELFNGDIGYITRELSGTDEDKAVFEAVFDDQVKRFSHGDINDIELAYATTVHKSQGSEYPVVIIPVHRSHFIMLKRNLLYTGITRAKKFCILVGTMDAVTDAVRREDTEHRDTMLTQRILCQDANEAAFSSHPGTLF